MARQSSTPFMVGMSQSVTTRRISFFRRTSSASAPSRARTQEYPSRESVLSTTSSANSSSSTIRTCMGSLEKNSSTHSCRGLGERHPHLVDQCLGGEWFDHIIVNPGFNGIQHPAFFGFSRDHDQRRAFVGLPDAADQRDPVHVGHVPVNEN